MIEDYRKACKRGRREVNQAIAQGRHPYPPSLDEALEGRGTTGELPLGVREIPMELVVGTKVRGRSNVFSRGFLPIADESSEFAAKWSNLFDSQKREGIRDPVVVYEYLQHFYVQEGNKRVSVLRYLDAPTVLASVTRVLPAASDEDTVRCYREFERLWRVAPVYGLIFSEEGSYERLARLLGQDLQTPWPEGTVRNLATTLQQFATALKARGGDSLPVSVADALLVYLEAYANDNPIFVMQREMDKRVARIWDELVVAASDTPIAYIEDPSQAPGGIKASIKGVSRAVRRRPLRMAFVYDRRPDESGWVAQHELGRKELERRLAGEVETTAFCVYASDEGFDHAVATAVADEADVIITASPRQMSQTRRAAVAYPLTKFANCSVNLPAHAVRTFYARMYEVKFLMGALAASVAENHRIGYVATSPIFGSIAEVNAFALGAALVDPYATVFLKWLAAEGQDWRRELLDDDVFVVAGRDYANPADPAEPFGLYRTDTDGTSEQVAVPVWDWGRYYELMARSIKDESWRKDGAVHKDQAINYWWGMAAGVVRLDLRDGVAAGTRQLMRLLQGALVDGYLRPFDGVLAAQRGDLVRDEGAPGLSSEEIASMRWLNGNIVGRLPKTWELTPDGAATVAASGVISAQTDAEED